MCVIKARRHGVCEITVKRTRLVLLDCTPGFAGRAIQQHSLVRFTVISHAPMHSVRKRSIRVEIGNILSLVTLQFGGWPWKTIGHLQTGITVQKRSIWAISAFFLSHVTLKFERWPWQTIGHLFYTTSSFVHHFIAMGEFKLTLLSGNAQFGFKIFNFCPVWHPR